MNESKLLRPKLEASTLSRLSKKENRRPLLHCGALLVALACAIGGFERHRSVLGYLIAALAVGTVQHHLSIVQHEANHFLLFTARRWNERIGALASHLVGFTMAYRRIHFRHHQTLGYDDDPDLPNYLAYPMSPAGFGLDLLGCMSGFAAVKQLFSQILVPNFHSIFQKRVKGSDGGSVVGLAGVQFALLTGFTLCGRGQDYFLLWIFPLITIAKSLAHFRNVVEHVQLRALADPELSRYRTIESPWWERVFFAPMFFNYHAEHHFFPSVPYFNLPELHRLLREQPAYRECVSLEQGYLRFLLSKAIRWKSLTTDVRSSL